MKHRENGFLSSQQTDHNSEQFDYIKELHTYLWRIVRVVFPGTSGNLSDFVDRAIGMVESNYFELPEPPATETQHPYHCMLCGKVLAEVGDEIERMADGGSGEVELGFLYRGKADIVLAQ